MKVIIHKDYCIFDLHFFKKKQPKEGSVYRSISLVINFQSKLNQSIRIMSNLPENKKKKKEFLHLAISKIKQKKSKINQIKYKKWNK